MITGVLFIYLPFKSTHFVLKDEVPSHILYSVNVQLYFIHCHGQCNWRRWSTVMATSPPGHTKRAQVAQMTGITKPYPINNALAPAIACSSTIAQRGPDCAFGFPGSSTEDH